MSDFRKWNIEKGNFGHILVCRDEYEKGQPCDYSELLPEEAQAMLSKIAELEAENAKLKLDIKELRETLEDEGVEL